LGSGRKTTEGQRHDEHDCLRSAWESSQRKVAQLGNSKIPVLFRQR
jgi:hypothetical protein